MFNTYLNKTTNSNKKPKTINYSSKGIHFKSKDNLKIIRQDLQDRQDILQRQYPVNPVNPVKIPCFLKWIQKIKNYQF